MGRISWKDKKTNKEVCDLMNMGQELLKTIKSRKLKYFGHIKGIPPYAKKYWKVVQMANDKEDVRQENGAMTSSPGQGTVLLNAPDQWRIEKCGAGFPVDLSRDDTGTISVR